MWKRVLMNTQAYKIIKKNSPENTFQDIYHNLLKISWLHLFIIYIIYFLFINTFFAILFYIVPDSISAPVHNFQSTFFFSVQTFSTVGYGIVSPHNFYGNTIVVIEIMTGFISTALTTGLVFAKFSRPSAKILYSKNLLLTRFDNQKVLMFRIANSRSNQIISANVELHRVHATTSSEGKSIVRFQPLKLQKSYSPIFSLSWTVFHTIDTDSPLYGKTLEEIHKSHDEFYVIVNGTDGTFSQSIHDTYFYRSTDILENHHFVDILHREPDGTRVIDYQNFHLTTKDS